MQEIFDLGEFLVDPYRFEFDSCAEITIEQAVYTLIGRSVILEMIENGLGLTL